jgi:RHS repeat-associated protein
MDLPVPGPAQPRVAAAAGDGASNAVPVDRSLRVIAGETVQNRVVRWGDSVYAYDAQGRLVRKQTGSGERLFFSWNSEHQLVGSWSARGGEWSYHYDALGRRIAKQRHDGRHGAAAIWFIWDGMRMVQEEHGSRHCITTVYEDAGSYVPLARVEQALWEKTVRPEQIFHIHTDINGAPEELTTAGGQVAWRARYRIWGNLALEEWHRDHERDGAVERRAQNLRFQGQYYDAETGLHYNTFRYYDPDIGRFVSQDPIGLRGGLNLYQYAPDPVSWIDPRGLCSNPNGKKGGKAHQDKINDVMNGIRSRGLEPDTEYMVKTPNGSKSRRFVDVVGRDPNTGQVVEMHQVGRQTQAGNPVARETRALDDVQGATSTRPVFWNYN